MYLQKNTTSSKAWSTVSSTNASKAGAFFWGMAGSFHSIVTLYSTITRKKKSRMLLVKNCLLFIYSKVFQWQYKRAMQFVLWVAQKIILQAWMAYSIFKYMKLKSYDEKIFISIPNIFLITLKMNEFQRVYLL